VIPYRQPDGRPRIGRREQLLFESAHVRVGLFEARTNDPHFRFSAVPEEYLLVFPCTSTRIEHAGGRAFVADRNVVTFYNPGAVYHRTAVSARGDRAHWFALSAELLAGILSAPSGRRGCPAIQPGVMPPGVMRPGVMRKEPQLGFTHGPSDPASYRLQNEIVRSLVTGAVSPPAVEASVRTLASRVLAAADRAASEPSRRAPEADVVLTDRIRELLARRYAEPLSLGTLAAELECSKSHLCHAFRRVTGTTLHAHRDQLRLRRALLEVAENRGRLTHLGLDLGYSSHSHFTERFRRAFGRPPSGI
jgi:AraC family transcriptional regulator